MDTQNKFEKYILGPMTEAEKAEFEKELESNPLLKEQLEIEQAIVGQIRDRSFVDIQIKQAKEELEQEKFSRELEELTTETERGKKRKVAQDELVRHIQNSVRDLQKGKHEFMDEQISTAKKEMQKGKIIRVMLYSVSSIAALLLVFFAVQGVWQGQKYDKIYASNFTTYTNDYVMIDGNLRGDQETTRGEAEVDSITAMTAYEKKDFATAETQFNQILSGKDNPEIRFYLAITQLETSKTKEALKNLQLLYAQPKEYRYYEQTRWYLALLQLKLHEKGEAKKYLDELVALDGVYLDKAKDLIRNL